jgi:vancomycin aglycone glucosyltransferase
MQPALCAPPNFQSFVKLLGSSSFRIGPDAKKLSQAAKAPTREKAPLAQRQAMDRMMVRRHFDVLPAAVQGCDAIVGGDALSIAAHSIAESVEARYRFVAFCPATFPTAKYALNTSACGKPGRYGSPPRRRNHRKLLWSQDARGFNDVFRAALSDVR